LANCGQNGYLSSHKSSAKYEDTTKTKYMTQWCNRQYKQVQFSNCVCKYQMFIQKTGQVGFCLDK
jgi:hypothetical protein